MKLQAGTLGAYDVTHDYSGVVVLRDVDFSIRAGQVNALVGENGSGKSTLIRILTGVLQASSGSIRIDGSEVRFSAPREAQQQSVAVVHQDYHLFPELSVMENVLSASAEFPRRRWPRALVDWGESERRVKELFDQLGADVSPTALVRSLGLAERKFVEIARAMALRPRFLILDEPTAALDPAGAKQVLGLLRRLRADGIGLCFISHRLDEVLQLADSVTVLRDGVRVDHFENGGVTEEELAQSITGVSHAAEVASKRADIATGDPVLKVSDLELAPGCPPLSFALRRGETLGVTGLIGSGARDIVRMVGGAEALRGNAEVFGNAVNLHTPREASKLGIGFIPEDRRSTGLLPEQAVATNISLSSLGSVSVGGWISPSQILARAQKFKQRLDIRVRSLHARVKTLSGGNQQKVMLAKWLASGARILAIEEPTHGIDIGAKRQVHQLLRDFAAGGRSILLMSSDLAELLELCDRVAVMRHGELAGMFSADDLTEADITVLSTTDAAGAREPAAEDTDGRRAAQASR